MFSTADTIVAVATPAGRGGIGVVRLSGPDAPRIAQTLVGRARPFSPRRAVFAKIVEPTADSILRAVDQVVVTFFAAPQSYTGEDVVEISGHGSPLLLDRIVELSRTTGARMAEPGEFTLRAYLNGRLDLIQAEAVADVIDAVTPLQVRAAMDQLEGTLTQAIGRIDRELFDLSARLEASLDFPDEGFHFVTRADVRAGLGEIKQSVTMLIGEGRGGRVLREGRLVAIVGPPNAGKSSLFNALVGAARAIVTEIPGTTRDVLTERVDLDGLLVTLVDTAGLRETTDVIESEGVVRAKQTRDVAALSLLVLDGSVELDAEERGLLAARSRETIVVINKSDLSAQWAVDAGDEDASVRVSARTGVGLEALRKAIARRLTGKEDLREAPRVTNRRHLALMEDAVAALSRAEAAIDEGATEELVLVDMGAARAAFEEVTGHRTPDDVLRHIFATFCVGK